MNAILEDLQKILKTSTPFVGFTMREPFFSQFESGNKFAGCFGETQIVPNYCVPNQSCAIAKWSSRKQMMKYVERKDKNI